MKTFLINPVTKTIEEVDLGTLAEITSAIGFDTITHDVIGKDGDRIYFDEDCFIRGTDGRFQIDDVIPIAGNAVIVGTSSNGDTLQDVSIDIDDLRDRIKFT